MLLVVYAFIIRSVLEYAFPVWSALLEYSSDFVELMQKKAFGIIFPGVHYRDSLVTAFFPTFKEEYRLA